MQLRWTDIEIRKFRMPESPTKIDDHTPIEDEDELPPPLEELPPEEEIEEINTTPERIIQRAPAPMKSEMNFEELD